ncbi:hypothetical protein LGT39_09980 [Demequina sp. TTPB684]|nr:MULTISPECIES: hypothetical protein [unclassified Demequina]MCB2413170.1 hypothetical protein [Demequina sp. TTPB684]UPU89676.1 hypothetical protein LGT36_007040 [Demequina sp. TMPB413]
MRASRVLVVTAVCAAVLATGYALAPEPVPALELVTPVSAPAEPQEAAP